MARTAALRAQHDAAEEMIEASFNGIEEYRDERDAYPLSLKLARLAGIFRDGGPDSLSADDRIGSSRRGDDCAGVSPRAWPLGGTFDRFIERWARSDAIASALRRFEYEAGMLFAAVRNRVTA